MNDDWRLRVDLHDRGHAHRLGAALQDSDIEHDLARGYGDRVVVSVDGPDVFLYSGDRAQAQAAEALVGRIAGEQGWAIESELRHWHPVAELWEDPANPEPVDSSQRHAEDEIRNAGERRESAEQGYPDMEVRVTCRSRHEAAELAHRLAAEGIVNIHRWSWVLVGANDEDDAEALARRLRDELPGAEITVEANRRKLWDERPGNPFAILGGLGG